MILQALLHMFTGPPVVASSRSKAERPATFLRLVIINQNFGRSFGSYSIYGEQTMNYDTNDMDFNCREFGSNIRPQLDDQYTGGVVGRIPRK